MYQQLILASASPRRREILEQAGIPFVVQVADFDEESVRKELGMDSFGIEGRNEEDYTAYVKALALGKAQAVFRENADVDGTLVLGADTVVVHRGEILNKPVDLEDARRMLLRLQGDIHAVYTGVALCHGAGQPDNLPAFVNFAVRTEVVFYPMDKAEVEEYLACGEYMDKAGAYAIQGRMAAYIREIHGDYYNVVGLPLSSIVQELKKLQNNV
ncbi:MAG: Maf family protein [Lachnospiraceae bacterium]|nr:Maf family protein [Lachnospiraceae bacterium]